MTIKHYRDDEGNYLGGFSTPPSDLAIEIEVLPDHASQKWDGTKWIWPASYSSELASLNAAYQADFALLRDAHAGAALAGGTNQASKQAAITAQFAALRATFLANSAALKIKYGA